MERRCSACRRRDSFFFRPYSGQSLCRKCFTKSIERKVRQTIVKYKMLDFNDKIAVAVSGGKDSLALLQILSKMEKSHPKVSLEAIIVDEGIKGYRDEAILIASEKCRDLDIAKHIISFRDLFGSTMDEIVSQNKKAESLTSCSFCGVLRRRALNTIARKIGATKIATGHTLDDEVQTALMNVLRGDIVRLRKEKPKTDEVHPSFVQKIKPLCEIPEKETALYAYVNKVNFQVVPCPYAAEAYRNDVRSVLNRMEEKHVGTKFAVSSFLERIRPALETLESSSAYGECLECGEPSSSSLCKVCEMLRKIR